MLHLASVASSAQSSTTTATLAIFALKSRGSFRRARSTSNSNFPDSRFISPVDAARAGERDGSSYEARPRPWREAYCRTSQRPDAGACNEADGPLSASALLVADALDVDDISDLANAPA